MGYTLDQVAEKSIHAICELIVFKERILLDAESSEGIILHDVIQDLATGFAFYTGLSTVDEGAGSEFKQFVRTVHECTTTTQLAALFKRIPKLNAYLMAPYFSLGDLARIEKQSVP
jgi:hypothetical protein